MTRLTIEFASKCCLTCCNACTMSDPIFYRARIRMLTHMHTFVSIWMGGTGVRIARACVRGCMIDEACERRSEACGLRIQQTYMQHAIDCYLVCCLRRAYRLHIHSNAPSHRAGVDVKHAVLYLSRFRYLSRSFYRSFPPPT